MKKKQVHSRDVKKAAIQKLIERGVQISDIAEIVHLMQAPYSPDLQMITCVQSVEAVLEKERFSMRY